jgi:hypothetical protein
MIRIILSITLILIIGISCGYIDKSVDAVKNLGKSDEPSEISIPSNPIERAAVQGLITSYKESTMWQIQNVKIVGITPMAPSGVLIELQDPKEVYCVCVEYEARYKVEWSTSEGSPWEKTVRNQLVIKTQGDTYLPMMQMGICDQFCGG